MFRVLVIDDDKLARKGLIALVPWEECGMHVVGDVSNGMSALEFLKENPADLAVVDISMPVLSGLDFIREGKRLYPGLQYVVLSFHESFKYVQEALRLGALDYISKLQLEQEDCSAVFARVGRLMQQRNEKQTENAGNNLTLDETAFEALKEEWRTLYWLYDAERFEALMTRTREAPLGAGQLERILAWTVQAIETTFEKPVRMPVSMDGQMGLNWIEAYRSRLYEEDDPPAECFSIEACVLRAVRYILKHLREPITSTEVAVQVGMSRGYFSTNFKKITGTTFNNFVRRERVHVAKQLLQAGHMSVGELAEAVGYEDAKYFAHVFWELTGVNCSEFERQKSLKQEK